MKLQILQLIIVSPERVLYDGQVESVNFPGTMGSFMVLPEHAPIISSLGKGLITYSEGGVISSLAIQSGFVEVNQNIISVCVEQ
ncbi:MAG: F0F1 ATP synthase subunit epsilon [Bacteroides sp.]